MYIENLAASEMERIAYLTGDTMAATAFSQADDFENEAINLQNELDDANSTIKTLEAQIEELEANTNAEPNHTETLDSALSTVAALLQTEGKINKSALLKMALAMIEVIAAPEDFTATTAREIIAKSFEVQA
jgi:uncharacterized protein YlxW (UPF0749 family)